MAPLFLPGDKLRLEAVGSHVERGWVVVYSSRGEFQAHRVTRVRGEEFWARGDNMINEDGPLGLEAVVGRVMSVERDGKLSQPWGLEWPRLGLGRAEVLKNLRLARAKWPRLARIAERRILGHRLVRWPIQRFFRHWLGNIEIEVEELEERTLAEMLSQENSRSEDMLQILERQLRGGEIALLVLRDQRRRKQGLLVLRPASDRSVDDCASVFSIWIPFWLRGIGLGSKLVSAAMGEAGRRGYKRIGGAIGPENTRCLGMFHTAGFREVSKRELLTRGAPWDKKELEGKLWLEREL